MELGDAAADELLSAHARPEEAIALRDAAWTATAKIDVERIEALANETRADISGVATRAWRPASEMAARLRHELGLTGPVDPDTLSALFGHRHDLFETSTLEQAAGWDDGTEIRMAVRKNNAPGARFEVTRLVGDYLAFGDGRFRPVLDTNSWCQQFQRSFGQAFLAPIELIRARKPSGRDWTGRDIENAADYFHVSSWVIDDALRNNGDIVQTGLIDREPGLFEAI